MPRMKKNPLFMLSMLLGLVLPLMLALPGNVWSADLHAAKQAGLIGEKPDGYLGLVRLAPKDVSQLVAVINQKRRAAYQTLATKNGLSLLKVELLAGKRNIQRTPANYYIQLPSGAWQKNP